MKLTARQRTRAYRQLLKFNEEIEVLTEFAKCGEEPGNEFWQKILQSFTSHRDALKDILKQSRNETNTEPS